MAGVGDAIGDVLVLVTVGPVALVVYEPPAVTVTKIDCTNVGVPVAVELAKHPTAHSSGVPTGTSVPREIRAATLPTTDPPNGAVTAVCVPAPIWLPMDPFRFSAYKTADPWSPVGHAVMVDQVGVEVLG